MALKILSGPLRLGSGGGLQIKRSSSSFDPTTIANLVVDFDPNRLGLTDGTAISSLTDYSGNTRPALQATGANQPLLKTNIVNGKAVARFDGVNDCMRTSAAFTVNSPQTWYLVVRFNSAFAGSNQCLMDDSTIFKNVLQRRTDSNTLFQFAGGTGITVAATTTNWNIYTVVFNGASSETHVNGGSAFTGSPGTANITAVNLGSRGDQTAEFAPADYARVLLYGAAHNGTTQGTVVTALKSLYGIA